MKREHLIAYLRVAGYHDDAATYTRLLIENRISMKAAKQAFAEGAKQRERGVPCECRTCKAERGRAKLGPPAYAGTYVRPDAKPGEPAVVHHYEDGSLTFGCTMPEFDLGGES